MTATNARYERRMADLLDRGMLPEAHHHPHVEHAGRSFFHAACGCGWEGQARRQRRWAGRDALQHQYPPSVVESEAWDDSPSGAMQLHEDGFRPVHAEDVKVGQDIACREEWFAMPAGPVKYRRVTAVRQDEYGTVTVELAGDEPGDVDEWAEVWVRDTI